MLRSFVVNDELVINEESWQSLNKEFSKEVLIEALHDVIEELPFPYKKITTDSSILAKVKLDSFTGRITNQKWFSRYEYDSPFSDRLIPQSRVGREASDYFFHKLRMEVDSINAPSAMRSWNIRKLRTGFLKALWTLKVKKVDSTTLRSAIALRKYIPSQFPPHVAKTIYNYVNPSKVLDFSSGWGDRLVASKGIEYWGVDPHTALHPQYKKMIEFHNMEHKNMICSPFEDSVDIPYNYFDLVFTSPPYFRVEKYSKEDTQSHLRYPKLDAWLNGFLFPSLARSWGHLRKGGALMVNISDVYALHTINKMCDPMVETAKGLGFRSYPAIGIQFPKRPRSKAQREGVFGEPLWVFEKV